VTGVAHRLGAAGTAHLDRYGSIAEQWVRPMGAAVEQSNDGTDINDEGET
jgi:hypothetical protein